MLEEIPGKYGHLTAFFSGEGNYIKIGIPERWFLASEVDML
jgi:hypothetical protein